MPMRKIIPLLLLHWIVNSNDVERIWKKKMCKEDILRIKKEKETLNTALQQSESNSINETQLKYCKLYYHDCKDQLHMEETKRKNLEKTFDNATLECSKAQKFVKVTFEVLNVNLMIVKYEPKRKKNVKKTFMSAIVKHAILFSQTMFR